MRVRRLRKGFTLSELLVACGVFAILLGLYIGGCSLLRVFAVKQALESRHRLEAVSVRLLEGT